MAHQKEINPFLKILIVDDDLHSRILLKRVLTKTGLTDVTEADDGTKALNLLKKEFFDLVISDHEMPHMTGMDLLLKIRKGDIGDDKKELPFIMASGNTEKKLIAQAFRSKVTGYIVKPVGIDALSKALRGVF